MEHLEILGNDVDAILRSIDFKLGELHSEMFSAKYALEGLKNSTNRLKRLADNLQVVANDFPSHFSDFAANILEESWKVRGGVLSGANFHYSIKVMTPITTKKRKTPKSPLKHRYNKLSSWVAGHPSI